LANGNILMNASWGRPGGDFKQFAAKYPCVCFTREGMPMIWSTEIAHPNGGFGPGNPRIGGGKCAIFAYPLHNRN
jgi:hypothetical protein